jgi:hypothetical protein
MVKNVLEYLGEGGESALATFLEPYIKRAVYDPEAENATAGEIAGSALEGAFFSALLDGGLKALESADGLGEMVKSKSAPAQKDGAADPAKLNRVEENLFAEIERDWYENEEKPEGKENEGDDWDNITVEEIGRSVGAKAKNYKVYNPITGENMYLTEGTRITQPQNHVIAGKGRERQIDELPFLIDKWGGDPLEWTKEKGFGYVDDEFGDSHRVELHWYQEPTTGKHKMKIKIQPDGRIYLDED